MGDEGRVGVLMGAGCAFVCLFLFVSLALTEVAMQDRRLVSCADALASVGGGNASSGSFFVEGDALEVDEAGVRSPVEEGLAALSDTTCKVGDGVTVSAVNVSDTEVEVTVSARPTVSLVPPVLRTAAVPELMRTSSARLREAHGQY